MSIKKMLIVAVGGVLLALSAFPQHNRDAFRISMEENRQGGKPNMDSKGEIEKLLFGDFNALVEFFYSPAEELVGKIAPSGFRVVRDSLYASFSIEVKFISNFEDVIHGVIHNTALSGNMWQPWHGEEERRRQQAELRTLQRERQLQLFTVSSLSFPINQSLAERIQEKLKTFISVFEEENPFPPIRSFSEELGYWIESRVEVVGGDSVTFRTVVNDEVWSLWIHAPRNKALEFSTLFRQMIEDAKVGEFNEERYMEILNAM